jgi:hypothetical protein
MKLGLIWLTPELYKNIMGILSEISGNIPAVVSKAYY